MKMDELEQTFLELSTCEYKGVLGVKVFDSGVPGPVVGITIQTHGNEPVGLAVYPHLKKELGEGGNLRKGKVFIVVNNVEGSRKFFEAMKANLEGAEDVGRVVDVNMNRLPTDFATNLEDQRYEVVRSRELLPIWSEFEYGLDIHSTSLESPPMIVALNRSDLSLMSKFPFTNVITNIENVQLGIPASASYGNENTSVFGLEAGQHGNKDSFDKALDSTNALLNLLGVINTGVVYEDIEKNIYHITQSMMFPSDTYKMAKTFETFESVKKGDVVMVSDTEPDVTFPFDCFVLFARDPNAKIHKGEEALFMAIKQ